MDLTLCRRFYAEEIEATSNLRTPELVEALATIARERFLPPGPWLLKADGDMGAPPRPTPDADPRRVYHNLAIGIDPTRMLFNGQPGFVSRLIDVLALTSGSRVLHVGCGTGYYTALIASIVGPTGRVVALDVDGGLAAGARGNLRAMPWADVRAGDASAPLDEPFDAMLINAGVTHPLDVWLDALAPGGRLVVPITATLPAMGTIGKGIVVLVTKTAASTFGAQFISYTAIYSAVGLRDEALNAAIGQALQKNPMPRLTRLRRDAHEASMECWLHADRCCLSQ